MGEPMTSRFGQLVRFRRALAIVVQLGLVILSNWLAFLLRFDGAIPAWAADAFLRVLPLVLLTRAIAFVPFRLYQGLWRYTSVHDLMMLMGGITSSSIALFLLIAHAARASDLPAVDLLRRRGAPHLAAGRCPPGAALLRRVQPHRSAATAS